MLKITNIYGMSSSSTALIAQNMVANAAKKLGFEELGIFFYSVDSDSDDMLRARMDGILASLAYGDTVVYQFPSWNGLKFDKLLLEKIRNYSGVKLIIFVHDLIPFMWRGNYYLIDEIVYMLNLADVLILPTRQTLDRLMPHDLKVEKIVFQEIWDSDVDVQVGRAPFNKIINFIGDIQKFRFVDNYHHNIPIHCHSRIKDELNLSEQVKIEQFLPGDELVKTINKRGGFGLVWSEEEYTVEYLKSALSYKIGTYIVAHIPIILSNDNACAAIIRDNNLGITVDSIEEAVEKINALSDEEYSKMQDSVINFAPLLRNGYFSIKALVDSVHLSRRAPF